MIDTDIKKRNLTKELVRKHIIPHCVEYYKQQLKINQQDKYNLKTITRPYRLYVP